MRWVSILCAIVVVCAPLNGQTLNRTSILPYSIIDAEYSKSLDRIISISANPDRLRILDPISGAEDGVVNLPSLPKAVSVGPDGVFAAVGHDNLVTYIDLRTAQVVKTFQFTVYLSDVVLAGNGFIYALSMSQDSIRSIEISSGAVTGSDVSTIESVAKLHPAGNALYVSSYTSVQRVEITTNPVRRVVPTFTQFIGCRSLWLSNDGLRVFNGCSRAFRASANWEEDLRPNGTLQSSPGVRYLSDSQVLNSLVVIPFGFDPTDNDTELYFYDYETLALQEKTALPRVLFDGAPLKIHGRFVFFNNAGTQFSVIAQAEGGGPADFALLNYSATPRPGRSLKLSEQTPVSFLNYSITDAAYTRALEKIVTVSEGPNRLHVFNPYSRNELWSVALDAPPKNMALSHNGRFAAVNHGRSISYVNLSEGNVRLLRPSFEVAYVAFGANGLIYAIPLTFGPAQTIRSIHPETGVETAGNGLIFTTGPPRVDTTGRYLYTYSESSDLPVNKFRIESAAAEFLYQGLSSSFINSSCRNVWPSQDGRFFINGCATLLNSSETRSLDLQPITRLPETERITAAAHSSDSHRLAVITSAFQGDPVNPVLEVQLKFFSDQQYGLTSSRLLPSFVIGESRVYAGHGRFVFFSSDGAWCYVLLRANNEAGLLFDHAFLALPVDASSPPRVLLSSRGSASTSSTVTSSSLITGSAAIAVDSNSPTPAGVAIIGYRQNNVLVTEAAVSSSRPMRSGRVYAEVSGTINTGLAIANPWNRPVSVSFYFTNDEGRLSSGTVTLGPNAQIAAFLDQVPFAGPARLSGTGTLTFTADSPVAVVALRGFTNQRSEFILTTLPVTDLDESSGGMVVFPHFATGGGWKTQLILINPSSQPLSGTIQFWRSASTTLPGQPANVSVNGQTNSSFSFTISPESSQVLEVSPTSPGVQVGYVRVTAADNLSPGGLAIFSFDNAGVTVSSTGVPASRPGTAFETIKEGLILPSNRVSVDTGVAIANLDPQPVDVTLEFTLNDGVTPWGRTTIRIPGNGQRSAFLDQLGFRPDNRYGLLRISTNSQHGIAVTALRGRYNERSDFLISTLPLFTGSESAEPILVFPHLAQGAGYTTQFFLMNMSSTTASLSSLRIQSPVGVPIDLRLR